jgi:hypothetical protein
LVIALAQPVDALGHRVAVRVGPLHGLDQLVDDVRRRRPVGIAHAHVDDVFAAPARRHLQLAGDVEDVGGQALDARELSHFRIASADRPLLRRRRRRRADACARNFRWA